MASVQCFCCGSNSQLATIVAAPASGSSAIHVLDCTAALLPLQVLLVTGDTGCGKSTQVPQFIMEAAAEQRQLHNTKIIVAQPRRLITTGGAGGW